MSDSNGWKFNRRGVLKSSMAVLGGGLLSRYSLEQAAAEQEPAVKNVNLNSSPSTLKITDMRYAIIVKPGPSPCPIIRIDTNQGVYGLGEVRDVGGYQYAMVLKNRIVGENPLKIDYLFQKIQQFGGISRQAGGVCAVEMALWDIAGKSTTARCTRCWVGNGGIRSASMRIRPSRMIRKNMDGARKSVKRWVLPG